MALITCPHCGKNVSDTLETCFHCGGRLKSAPEKEREYTMIPLEEQRSLRAEFKQKFPQVAQSDKNLQRSSKKYIILSILFGSIALGGLVFLGVGLVATLLDNANVWWMVGVGAGCLVIGVAMGVIFYRIICKIDKNQKRNTKRFQVWLKEEKNIHLTVILDKSEQKIYDDINID